MAAEFTQESVLRFILSNGGKVRNADLLTHYRRFLREDEEREQNRELFKKYVNSVATVRQEDDASHVVLRKKYRALLGDVAKNLDPTPVSRNQDCILQTAPKTRVEILPAAGIVTATTKNNNNNDFTPSFEKDVQTLPRSVEQPVLSINSTCPLRPAPPDIDSRSSGSGQSVEQPGETKVTQEASRVEHDVYAAKQRQLREADGCEQSFVKPTCYYEVRASPLSGKPDTSDAYKQFPKHAEGPPLVTIGQSHISTSTPCLLDAPQYVHAPLFTQAGLSRSNDSLRRPHGAPDAPKPQNAPPALYLQPCHPKILTTSQDSLSTTSPTSLVSDTGWNQGSGREEGSSDDGSKYLSGQDENDVRSFLRRNQETRLLSQLHQPSHNVGPLHHSTGHLDDQSSSRSASPETHHGPVARRLSSRLRSRMCRSLGENLDLPFPEDTGSARHNRLQLLSSTLSMGNLVSAPSSRGSRDFSSPAGSMRSLHDGSFSSKHSSVPLDPREHEWFVKAASGTWTDIYALFREDPNLLYKRDFISGFTILHWIAKHGDHRVLNTLSYGVEKAGMTLDMDAKTLCGYTPLHLAAIHGHKKLIRLVVQKFKADVRVRDSSGKRPWQYLSQDENRDIFELLGAPQKMIGASSTLLSSGEKLPMRPATAKINVKRHASIAALFKHKSHLRVSSASEAF
ncbi:ankyrin repeat domain-containing protein SOWAHB-like [Triplophysa rosa]|uniref:Ankyrin repeat domain-containing protein SOWAHB n=1 Tax=Triplophysa rosa TaxID=992332 RepID=A0A9W7WFM4_TRIRA|nr:ankyrin repeat domain-containing protein SOWAHB-like [Triplophysa rosa]KAI7795933.1 putative ankyrin repeat domain-containing protein SOWAHB [Triplophysa rosa]